jgi:Rps23 Pro-64 3,4-dihydroxylase Tpa1-like proline 4-hydroxylase
MVTMDNFLVEDKAEKLGMFLATEAQFGDEFGLYSMEDGADKETWDAADEEDRFFRFGKLVGIASDAQFSPNALTYLQFRKTFQDVRFKEFFQSASNLQLDVSDDFGSHRMRKGDFLRQHDDDNKNRRLAIVVYLTPDWELDEGGALHVVDSGGNQHTVAATFNRMVMFDTLADTTHYVDRITPQEDSRNRYTIGGWYHKPE